MVECAYCYAGEEHDNCLGNEPPTLYIAMPLYGSGSRFPAGIFTTEKEAHDSQLDENGYSYHRPMVLEFKLGEFRRP